jgi:phosphate transport system substrate-binding protein
LIGDGESTAATLRSSGEERRRAEVGGAVPELVFAGTGVPRLLGVEVRAAGTAVRPPDPFTARSPRFHCVVSARKGRGHVPLLRSLSCKRTGTREGPLLPRNQTKLAAVLIAGCLLLAACGGDRTDTATAGDLGAEAGALSGQIRVDGSSTVTPLIALTAEDFQSQNSGVRVTVGTSGTGGGFEKFCSGETDISMASRRIKDQEVRACRAKGIEPLELIVANDGLSVVVHRDNDWAKCLTVEQLNKVWEPGSAVNNWNQIDPSFPDQRLKLFGAGSDSGTFDYFTYAINGKEGATRTDYNPSEDDNVTVAGVSGDKGAMGYFGLSYLLENEGKVRGVKIDGGDGCVAPTTETVQFGDYRPLSRPLFIYTKADAAKRSEVKAFADYYLEHQEDITREALFVPLTKEQVAKAREDLAAIDAA